MSQWGAERWFSRGKTKIRILAHVDTATWRLIGTDSLVDDLFILKIQGDRKVAEQMLVQLKTCYVGKPHSLWAEPMMTEM